MVDQSGRTRLINHEQINQNVMDNTVIPHPEYGKGTC